MELFDEKTCAIFYNKFICTGIKKIAADQCAGG